MAFPASLDEYDPPRPAPPPAVLWLLVAGVAAFFVQLTLAKDLPALLGFRESDVGNRALWRALTYALVHGGVLHAALNMYTLWAFGPRVERAMGTASFCIFYAFCALGGAVFQWLFVPGDALLVGASAAIFGVMLAYAMRWPDDEVMFFGVVPMRMRWLLWVLVAVNLVLGALSAGRDGGGVAYLAHLGGLAFGLLYLLRPTAPSVDRLRQRVATAPDLGDDPPRPVPRSLPRPRERQSEVDEVVEQSKALTMNKPPRPAPPPPQPPRPIATAASRREALDLVLDKISESGLGSLTLEERTLLEEMSRTLRDT